MGLTVWVRCFGGPKCGVSIEFPPDEPYLPVSCRRRSDHVDLWRVGRSLGDWDGELIGHYWISTHSGRAEFLELPHKVKGLYTRWNQADGETDDCC